ncbi:MAG: hypothetical protein H6652_23600 [Ardenticatenaceae bacterium]|nr:hypothetical protein [Ardenticatenaceae bacterium]
MYSPGMGGWWVIVATTHHPHLLVGWAAKQLAILLGVCLGKVTSVMAS